MARPESGAKAEAAGRAREHCASEPRSLRDVEPAQPLWGGSPESRGLCPEGDTKIGEIGLDRPEPRETREAGQPRSQDQVAIEVFDVVEKTLLGQQEAGEARAIPERLRRHQLTVQSVVRGGCLAAEPGGAAGIQISGERQMRFLISEYHAIARAGALTKPGYCQL